MHAKLISCLEGCLVLYLTAAGSAAEWGHYGNARYGYWIDIPPGFSPLAEADNGDGGSSESSRGDAKLSVWGSFITEPDFTSEVSWRIQQDKADGWKISYETSKEHRASWTGLRGTRMMYQRAITLCRDAAAYFRIEYDQSQNAAFDPIVERLVKSLRWDGVCR
ncbi:hypothetical protein [Mesorhizobium sp. KR1-2]|uniref:hypothetical protein n=1 Tax=Mesorhizobium sp. KR1-2 TaxID=3156609 RepID=UPI0032B587B1